MKNITFYKKRRDALLKKLGTIKPVLGGSVVLGSWKCSNHACRCHKGTLHSAWHLTWKDRKKTRTLYIPVDLREEVKEWNEEYKNVKRLLDEVSELNRTIIRRYAHEKRMRRQQ